jgi:hypothetical protein
MGWDKRIFEYTKKLHMYSGLLTFSAFLVWGITGVEAMFLPAAGEFRPPPVTGTQEVAYQAPGNLDDDKLSRAIYAAVKIPLAAGRYNVHRDEQSHLAFNVFTINGGREVAYLEEKGVVRIDHRRNSTLSYLSSMHTAHSGRHQLTVMSSLWGYFNEFSTWAFLFMTLSGLYLWIATRPGLRWAQLTLAATVVVTAALWFAIR